MAPYFRQPDAIPSHAGSARFCWVSHCSAPRLTEEEAEGGRQEEEEEDLKLIRLSFRFMRDW